MITIDDLINIAARHGHSLEDARETARMVLAAIQVQTGGPVDRAQLKRLAQKWGVNRQEVVGVSRCCRCLLMPR